MDELRKAAQQALEVLSRDPADPIFVGETMDALRAALAQPEQEPVAWLYEYTNPRREKAVGFYPTQVNDVICTPLYTAPPQRKPMTDEQEELIKLRRKEQ